MSIDPTKGGASPLSGARLDQTGANQSARRPEQAGSESAAGARDGAAGDQVQLSAEARAAGQTEAGASASGLSAERLQEILKRLTSGYYDTPQVRDHVAQRIHEEWRGPA